MRPDNRTADTNQMRHLTPTMLIGLGGTGKEVLLRIRRLFFERGGSQDGVLGYPIIGYLVLDTDVGYVSRLEKEEKLSSFVLQKIRFEQGDKQEEISCSITPNEFAQYFQGGKQLYPHIFSWMLPDMNRYTNVAIAEGAGQNRPFGRLAFFHNYRKIRQALESHLREILSHARDPNKLRKWRPTDAEVSGNDLEVALVCSLAGGTGAGMFLDMGMLVNVVLKEMNLPGLKPHVTFIVVLPEPFVQEPGPSQKADINDPKLRRKVQENAFTALREMEYFAMRRSEAAFGLSIPPPARVVQSPTSVEPLYRVRWEANGLEYAITECPWKTCYLVGGKNSMIAPTCLPSGEVLQMIAEHIFLDFDPSTFGREKRSVRSNKFELTLESIKDPVYDDDHKELYHRVMSRRFSTFGISQIFFDRERMQRAASFRLAWRVVHDWWLRRTGVTAQELRDKGQADIAGSGRERVVTNTFLEGDHPMPLTYQAVCWQICLADAASKKTWWDKVKDEADGKRREIQDGKHDSLNGESVLSVWQQQHLLHLKRSNATAGDGGLALRNYSNHRDRIEPDIEARVRALFYYRLHEMGVLNCLDLFRDYANQAEEAIREADEVAANLPEEPRKWKRRLEEAQRLPFRSRQAARWELLRAIGSVSDYLASCYEYGAADYVSDCLHRVRQRVAEGVNDGSYTVALARFRDLLQTSGEGGVMDYLHARFEELRKQDREQVRTIGLLAHFDPDEYDRRINRLIAPDTRQNVPDWEKIEARVLEHLHSPSEGDVRWRNVKRLGDLVLTLFDIKAPQPLSLKAVEAFANALAGACEPLLVNFGADLSALKQFEIEKPQERSLDLDKLRMFSAVYLCHNTAVSSAAMLERHSELLLGAADRNKNAEADRFRQDLKAAGSGDTDQLHNLRDFAMRGDAVVLYREKTGIPLCYDAGLIQLGDIYDRSDRKRETYLDHPYLAERLPEIRLVDQRLHKLLASCLEDALFGMMTGVLPYDRQKRKFRLTMHQAGGGTLTFPLGGRLEDVINQGAQNENVRTELADQVGVWLEDAARKRPERLLFLWCAIQYMHGEIQTRVQALIDRDRDEHSPSQGVHPLLSILGHRMLTNIRKKLDSIPRERLGDLLGAEDLDRSPLNWNYVSESASRLGGDEGRGEAWEEWQSKFVRCFEVIEKDEMPIPVLLPDACLNGC